MGQQKRQRVFFDGECKFTVIKNRVLREFTVKVQSVYSPRHFDTFWLEGANSWDTYEEAVLAIKNFVKTGE